MYYLRRVLFAKGNSLSIFVILVEPNATIHQYEKTKMRSQAVTAGRRNGTLKVILSTFGGMICICPSSEGVQETSYPHPLQDIGSRGSNTNRHPASHHHHEQLPPLSRSDDRSIDSISLRCINRFLRGGFSWSKYA